jgi:ribosomal protein S18 acetylase RimI-like enzyme
VILVKLIDFSLPRGCDLNRLVFHGHGGVPLVSWTRYNRLVLLFPDWTIRSAGEEDIASVLDLWAAAGSPPSVSDSPDGLARLLGADPQALLVAELDGVLVGSLIAAWDGWRGSFYRLAVSPEHRRQGLARMLLGEGERRLWERGAVRLTAIVAEEEAGAMGFWQAAGYERQRHRARFVRHPDG